MTEQHDRGRQQDGSRQDQAASGESDDQHGDSQRSQAGSNYGDWRGQPGESGHRQGGYDDDSRFGRGQGSLGQSGLGGQGGDGPSGDSQVNQGAYGRPGEDGQAGQAGQTAQRDGGDGQSDEGSPRHGQGGQASQGYGEGGSSFGSSGQGSQGGYGERGHGLGGGRPGSATGTPGATGAAPSGNGKDAK